AIMVTHDQEEALSFGDRLAVMRDGKVVQEGAPEEVYFSPATAFVASFLGRTNLLRGVASGRTARTSIGDVPLSTHADGRVVISLRPDHLSLLPLPAPASANGAASEPAGNGLAVARARVIRREFKGHAITLECSLTAPSTASGGASPQPNQASGSPA